MWGATRPPSGGAGRTGYFNPRSPCGERPQLPELRPASSLFQSTLPVWGATRCITVHCSNFRFQSTLPVWGATEAPDVMPYYPEISIHAPRVGSDYQRAKQRPRRKDFNPRSPCGERRCTMVTAQDDEFISIHAPRVGSDFLLEVKSCGPRDFNPRSPCGERLPTGKSGSNCTYFNPRSPCGERLTRAPSRWSWMMISIHAPRGGSDAWWLSRDTWALSFQSTLPVWGATLRTITRTQKSTLFQSTLPVWGATAGVPASNIDILISIHAPRVGSDDGSVQAPMGHQHFNPRSPCGERQMRHCTSWTA